MLAILIGYIYVRAKAKKARLSLKEVVVHPLAEAMVEVEAIIVKLVYKEIIVTGEVICPLPYLL